MMIPTKIWWKSKTLWVNTLGGVIVLLEYVDALDLGLDWLAGLLVVFNLVLRYVTKQPVSFTGKEAKHVDTR